MNDPHWYEVACLILATLFISWPFVIDAGRKR